MTVFRPQTFRRLRGIRAKLRRISEQRRLNKLEEECLHALVVSPIIRGEIENRIRRFAQERVSRLPEQRVMEFHRRRAGELFVQSVAKATEPPGAGAYQRDKESESAGAR